MRREQLKRALPDDGNARGALELCRRLQAAGHRAWLAGGCVRDLLMDEPIEDYDIASDASTREIASLFERTVAVGEAFGVMRVVLRGDPDRVYEVARFRRESGYSDARHPDQVEPGTPEEDASRRDFTINGLFLDPVTLEVIDHVGGIEDLLVARVVRAIGDARERFGEDHLRLLRAVRFVGRTGFALETATRAAIVESAMEVRTVSAERIHDELAKLFRRGVARGRAAGLLVELGLLHAILPAWSAAPGEDGAVDQADRAARMVDALIAAGTSFAGEEWLLGLLSCVRLEPRDSTPPRERMADLASVLALSKRERRFGEACLGSLCELEPGVPDTVSGQRLAVRSVGFGGALALLSADPDAGRRAVAARWEALARGWGEADLWPPRLLEPEELEARGVPRGPELGRALAELERAQLDGEVTDRAEALAWLARRAQDPESAR